MVHTNRVDLSPGGSSEAAPPVPIPNTVVKRFSAYDTALATEWENRSPPGGIPHFTDAPSLLHLSSLRPWCLQPQVTLRQPSRMDSAHAAIPIFSRLGWIHPSFILILIPQMCLYT